MYRRVRIDHIAGTVGGAGLAADAQWSTSTLTASILTEVPAVSAPDIIPLILDAERTGGAPEIAWITSHSAGASTATIMRGLEGTLPRAHVAGIKLFVGPTKTDFIDDPWIDASKVMKIVGDDSTDNTTNLNALLVLAAAGASWSLFPAVNLDLPVPVRLRSGIHRVSGELKAYDGVPLLGPGSGACRIKDMRAGATKSWTVATNFNSAVITVTGGGPPVADDKSMIIRGAGIPAGAFIVAVSGNDVTISTPCTATATGVSATVITVVTLSYRGAAQNDRIADVTIEGIQIWPDSASGHDNRINLLLRHVSHAHFRGVRNGDSLCAIFGHDLWDTDTQGDDIQYCGSRAAEPFGAVHLTASSQDGSDCNKFEMDHPTFENNYAHDIAMVGHGRRVNKCAIYGGAKFETNVARGHRILLSTTDDISFDPSTDISVGGFDSGYATPVDAFHLIDSLGPCMDGVNIEQKPSSGVAVLRHGVHWNGGVRGHRPRGLRMSNAGGNPSFTGKPFHCTGTNTALPAPGAWTYDGSSSEPDITTHPSLYVFGRTLWTPTMTSAGQPTFGTGGLLLGDFSIDDTNEVHFNLWAGWAADGTHGTATWLFDLPITADLSLITRGASSRKCGSVTLVRAGGLLAGSHAFGEAHITAAGKLLVVLGPDIAVGSAYAGPGNPFPSVLAGDAIHIDGHYPAGGA